MFVPHIFVIALVMMFISTICWGSWANAYKLTKNYKFQLAYWDFSIGGVFISLVLAWTMGSTSGGEHSFIHNLHSAAPSNMLYAFIGGFICNIANILLVEGIEIVGLAIAFPSSIGIALVEGVGLSYAIEHRGNALLLASGVGVALLAVILIGKAYGSLPRPSDEAIPRKGIVICVISGFLMGTFAPFNALALSSARPLTPYSVAVFFSFGVFLSCMIFNTYQMRKPLCGAPAKFSGYFHATLFQHAMGLISGVISGVGMVFSLVAASLVGVSISYAIGQASPMVAAFWGVFAFHEFRGSGTRAKLYLAGMFVCYIVALFLISSAK